jgi:hypothetical protein
MTDWCCHSKYKHLYKATLTLLMNISCQSIAETVSGILISPNRNGKKAQKYSSVKHKIFR